MSIRGYVYLSSFSVSHGGFELYFRLGTERIEVAKIKWCSLLSTQKLKGTGSLRGSFLAINISWANVESATSIPPPLNMCIFFSLSPLFASPYNRSRSLTQTLMTESLPQKGSNEITRSDPRTKPDFWGTRVDGRLDTFWYQQVRQIRLLFASADFQIKTLVPFLYWPIKFWCHLATRFGWYLFDMTKVRLCIVKEKNKLGEGERDRMT